MPLTPFELREKAPTPTQFKQLRELIGWASPSLDTLKKSMDASLYWVSIFHSEELIATGRVIGDGAMYFYVQDVIVHPQYQGEGLGARVMQAINRYLEQYCERGATIGLFAAKGKEGFYKQYDFIERSGDNMGLGMCRFV